MIADLKRYCLGAMMMGAFMLLASAPQDYRSPFKILMLVLLGGGWIAAWSRRA